MLLTSRPYGLDAAQRTALGRVMGEAALLELDQHLQYSFIQAWFAALDPADAKNKTAALQAELEQRDDLGELRANPLLLTALCMLFNQCRLPGDLYRLYLRVINQVLQNRYPEPSEQDKARRRLAYVALAMHTGSANPEPRATPAATVGKTELDRILEDYADLEPASEAGSGDVPTRRERLLSCSGLLLPRSDEQAAFYHFNFQDFLAAERLHTERTDLAQTLLQRASTAEWRNTLLFQFGAEANGASPQRALDVLRDVLLPSLSPAALLHTAGANRAALLLHCLRVAQARELALDAFGDGLQRACQASLAPSYNDALRNALWLTAGVLAVDRRSGVGLRDDGLPAIDWVPIPGTVEGDRVSLEGSVDNFFEVEGDRVSLEGSAGEFEVAGFAMARFPVTHAQFQAFVGAADGHRDSRWWNEEWLKSGFARAGRPDSPRWSEANAPREMVSWFEAVAFCRWLDYRLRAELPAHLHIRLPVEWEWQHAATGGLPGRAYPWGEEWQPQLCNHGESELGRTTAVGLYPQGTREDGPLDMAGNVWEWCLNEYDQPRKTSMAVESLKPLRVLRGGSWNNLRGLCRAASRYGSSPYFRESNIGFRVCLSSHIDLHLAP